MERFDIGDDARLSAIVDAAQRGEPVELTRDGTVVAEVRPASAATLIGGRIDLKGLSALRARFAHLRTDDTTDLIREMREMDDL